MSSLPPLSPLWTPTSLKSESPESQAIKAKAFGDFGFFMREFFPDHFWGEFSPLHQEIVTLETQPDRRGRLEVTAAPRGNAKTVFRVLAKVCHSILYSYHPFTVIIGYSAAEAEGKVKDIRDELQSNERIIQVYGQVVKGGGQQEFIAENGCKVVARGRGGQIRGLRHGKYRPTHIICDDVEDLEGCQSQMQREKTMAWFKKDVSFAGQSGSAYKLDITFVGTVLHEDSLLANLLKNPTAHLRSKYKAIVAWASNESLWEQWRKIFTDLTNDDAAKDARAFYEENEAAMLEGTEVLWPEGEPYYELMVQQLSMGKAAFYSEKQNEPFDPDSQILNPDLCPRFKVYFPHDPEWLPSLGDEGFAIVRQDNGKAIHSRDLKVIGALDPALGRKTKNGIPVGDFAALTIMAQDLWGYIYVLDVYLKKSKPDAQIKACFERNERWKLECLYLETIGFQELLKDKMVLEQKNWQTKLRIIGVDVHSQGKARIISLEPYISNGWILLNENLDPEFIDQLRLFPTVHDDGPDSLQIGVSRLKKPQGYIGTAPRTGESSSV